ncbi:hypothetical protein ROHU_003575 [Labeo rohita]|uniref:Uncharacterized protein n=1 Tax=Labeo rohita TaxID=84645 RepID=A0A498NV20_LABRO|nr:hypothetical protein ROHU_003575 [Labeo rohita]
MELKELLHAPLIAACSVDYLEKEETGQQSLAAKAAGVIYYCKRRQAGQNDITTQSRDQSGPQQLSPNLSAPMLRSPDGSETEAASETSM